jgi:hypothetical protein
MQPSSHYLGWDAGGQPVQRGSLGIIDAAQSTQSNLHGQFLKLVAR